MGYRSTTQTSFIGENAPLEALQHNGSKHTTNCSLTTECGTKDQAKSTWDLIDVHRKDDKACTDVEDCHHRNNRRSRSRNPTDATDHNQKNQYAKYNASRTAGDLRGLFEGFSQFKCLNTIADSKAGEHAKKSKQACHPGPTMAQSIADVIHRAAHMIAFRVSFTEMDSQHCFCIFSRDPEDGDQPHPKDCPRTTNGDRRGDPSNVSGPNGGRQRRHQGLERRDLSLTTLINRLKEELEAISELAQRNTAKPNHQEDACTCYEENSPRPPCESTHLGINKRDEILHLKNQKNAVVKASNPRERSQDSKRLK